jgi:hypothetical protein
VGNLQQNSRPVTRIIFASASATMFEVLENSDRLLHNPMRLSAFDINDEAKAARIMFMVRIVKTLL